MAVFRRPRIKPDAPRLVLPHVIADAVADAIAMQRLQPEDRVVETALAEELAVSRVPTREALKVLHTQGILTGGGHRGFRVARFDAATVARVLELRLMLESLLLRDAVANWRDGIADIAELAAGIAPMEAAARKGDRRASLRADLDFHRIIGQAARNAITLTLWEAIARHVLIIFSRSEYRDDDLFAVVVQHQQLLAFIQAQIDHPGPVEALRQAIEAHLMLVPRSKRHALVAQFGP